MISRVHARLVMQATPALHTHLLRGSKHHVASTTPRGIYNTAPIKPLPCI
jgi:hypothetical protein